MKDKWNKVKDVAKRYGPVVIVTAIVTGVATVLITRENDDEGWTALILSQEFRDEAQRNPDACAAFPREKIIVTGQEWNPNK